jgi:hypothetical protein
MIPKCNSESIWRAPSRQCGSLSVRGRFQVCRPQAGAPAGPPEMAHEPARSVAKARRRRQWCPSENNGECQCAPGPGTSWHRGPGTVTVTCSVLQEPRLRCDRDWHGDDAHPGPGPKPGQTDPGKRTRAVPTPPGRGGRDSECEVRVRRGLDSPSGSSCLIQHNSGRSGVGPRRPLSESAALTFKLVQCQLSTSTSSCSLCLADLPQ